MIFDELWRMERRAARSKRLFERKWELFEQSKENRDELGL